MPDASVTLKIERRKENGKWRPIARGFLGLLGVHLYQELGIAHAQFHEKWTRSHCPAQKPGGSGLAGLRVNINQI